MPERIALALGIPVTRGEFLARAEDAAWDYGRRLMGQGSPEHAFEHTYASVCKVASDVLEAAAAGGASIIRSLTLRQLAEISRCHDAIVLVAHWRGSELAGDDLLPGWVERLFTASEESHDREPALMLLRRDLPLGAAIARSRNDTPQLRKLCADTINRLIRGDFFIRWLPAGIGSDQETQVSLRDALSRDRVDELFDGHVRPGNQLELADGLHGVNAVGEALAAGFRGTLDLSCCTSSVLGTYLACLRDEALDIIMGDPQILPTPQLRLIEGTLELLAREPNVTYAAARRGLSRALAESVPR